MDDTGLKYSIITCTYNPNQIIFNRLIDAISKLDIDSGNKLEWIIVDNNSSLPIESQFDFSKLNHKLKIIKEKRPGLTFARIAGAKQSTGDWLIFFDDDNEPYPNFISILNKEIQQHEEVTSWGPGLIEVEFIGKVKSWFLKNKHYFQERNEPTKFGNEKHMQPYYPIGTGLCIKKESILDYIFKVEQGIYNVGDRTGKSLLSGGDIQIVLNNQILGNYSGKIGGLGLNHLIESRKATFSYLKKQKYWTASSYLIVLNEVYNNEIKEENINFSWRELINLFKSYYHCLKVKRHDNSSAVLRLCSILGEHNARYLAFKKQPSSLFNLTKKIIVGR